MKQSCTHYRPFMKKILDEKKGKFFNVFLDSQFKISTLCNQILSIYVPVSKLTYSSPDLSRIFNKRQLSQWQGEKPVNHKTKNPNK